MLYIFKSKAAGNLIMLQANGERVLQIIGKDVTPKGIVLPEQMPAAIAALEKAIEAEESGKAEQPAPDPVEGKDKDKDGVGAERVSLRQRAVPFIDMLKRCHEADKEIVWGV